MQQLVFHIVLPLFVRGVRRKYGVENPRVMAVEVDPQSSM
jgi:hypothetical protein